MDKSMGILLMVIFGVAGVTAAALAWFCPALHLDRFEATLAGLIGVGFAVFQAFRFGYSGREDAVPVPVEAETEEKA
jgi:hypothetical protein